MRPVRPTSGRIHRRSNRKPLLVIASAILCLTAGQSFAQRRESVGRSSSSSADIVRFLEQATFGPTPALVTHVQSVGMDGYLDEQFAAPISLYPTLPQQPLQASVGCPAGSPSTCKRDNYTMFPLQVQFFKNALSGEDQLRQRVTLALHEILVVSGVKIQQPSMMSPYLNTLARDAFTNYRQILYDVTLNPAMGRYLDMVNNDAPAANSTVAPNENYAREVLQLFSIGVNQLNQDGSVIVDASGEAVPTYDQEVIEDFAHVFTGWTFASAPGAAMARHNPANFLAPMALYRNPAGVDTNHDKGGKLLLTYPGAVNSVITPNQDGDKELQQAIDNIFNHPNVGPFIGKQLIQHLVTSNPSPAYVARVSAVFANNGAGIRGDMKAVVRAILLDPEARGAVKSDPAYGHLREPVLFMTGILRAFNARSDGELGTQANSMGQNLFLSPTVFSYYPHEYLIPGTSTQGPEFGIQSSSSSEARLNFLNALTSNGIKTADGGTTLDLSPLQQLAGNPAALTDTLNTQLLHGTMTADLRAAVLDAVSAVPSNNPLLRAQTAVYLVAGSSQYQIQR